MTSQRKSTPPRLAGLALAGALLASGLVGCSAQEEQVEVTEDVYCATADGTIVDEDLCDDENGGGGGSSFFIWHGAYGGSHHQPGHKLSGGTSFPYNDAGKRQAIGLPQKGKITQGGGFGTTVKRSVPNTGSKVSGGGGGGFGGGKGGSGG